VRLLLAAGASPEAQHDGKSAWVWAAEQGDETVLALLLEHTGAAVARSAEVKAALTVATQQGFPVWAERLRAAVKAAE
jgi:ankyrin repeat protein